VGCGIAEPLEGARGVYLVTILRFRFSHGQGEFVLVTWTNQWVFAAKWRESYFARRVQRLAFSMSNEAGVYEGKTSVHNVTASLTSYSDLKDVLLILFTR
jgi:hypothetical protein